MREFKNVPLNVSQRLKILTLLNGMQPDKREELWPIALLGVSVSTRFSASPQTVYRLLSYKSEHIYFRTIPKIQSGAAEQKLFAKTRMLRPSKGITRSVLRAAHSNRGTRRALRDTAFEIIVVHDRSAKEAPKSNRTLYTNKTVRPITVMTFKVAIVKTDANAIKRTRSGA